MANNQQHVNYIGQDGKVHELWYSDSGGWKHNILSDLAGADAGLPFPTSSADGYATPWNNQQHVNYIGNDSKVHELWYSGSGGWKHNILSDLAGVGPTMGGLALDGYATPWNQQQHVNYIGNDWKVHELWYSDSGGWNDNNLNDLAGAAVIVLSNDWLVAYTTAWNNQQHVIYNGEDGNLYELWYSDAGGWKHNILSQPSFGGPFYVGRFDGYATPWNKQQHVNYIDRDSKVHELWYSDSDGWQHNILSDLAGADAYLANQYSRLCAYATLWNNQQHVVYVGHDWKIHELWYSDSGGWKHNILSDLAGADGYLPDSAEPRLAGYATPWNNQQHVIYVGQDGKVHELWYSDSDGWKHNILSDLAGAADQNSLPTPWGYAEIYGNGIDGYVTSAA